MFCDFTTTKFYDKYVQECTMCGRRLISKREEITAIGCKLEKRNHPHPMLFAADIWGVGSELYKLLLVLFKIEDVDKYKCDNRIKFMNQAGIKWCSQNIDIIVDWLKEEAEHRKCTFVEYAAKLLVKRAIKFALNNTSVDIDNITMMIDYYHTSKQIPTLINSLKNNSKLPPVLLFINNEGNYHLREGHHRLSVYYLIGKKTLERGEFKIIKAPQEYKSYGTVMDLIQRSSLDLLKHFAK